MTKNEINPEEILQNRWEIFNSQFDGVFTKTTQFMLASLEVTLSTLMLRAFVNAFLDDADHDHDYIRPLFLLFRVLDNKRDWERMYVDITKNPNYIRDYNVGQENGSDMVMFVFRVPAKYTEDYYNFKRGRYSKFSNIYKSKFTKYISSKTKGKEESVIWQVIHKADTLKRRLEQDLKLQDGILNEQEEIWDEPRREREVYNYKKSEKDGDSIINTGDQGTE